MTKYLLKIFVLLTLLTSTTQAGGGSADIDVEKIVRHIDQLYRSESSYSELEMEIITPHWQRTLKMEGWTSGVKKTFIRISAPKKEKGVATLRIGNQMWNYLPRTNKVIKIPPSMMMSSWMGSDFTNDDLVKEFTLFEDYQYELIQIEDTNQNLIHINCIPKEDLPVVWGNIVIAVTPEDYIPVWQKYYTEEGKLMRVLRYSNVKTFGHRRIPATLEMVPQNKKEHKTVIRYLKLELNLKLDQDVFSLRNLRQRS